MIFGGARVPSNGGHCINATSVAQSPTYLCLQDAQNLVASQRLDVGNALGVPKTDTYMEAHGATRRQ